MNIKLKKQINKSFIALKNLRPKKLYCNFSNDLKTRRYKYFLNPNTLSFSPKLCLFPAKMCKLNPNKTLLQNINNVEKIEFFFNSVGKNKINTIPIVKSSNKMKKSISMDNILKTNKKYKYLKKSDIKNLTNENLDIGFLSNNPKTLFKDLEIQKIGPNSTLSKVKSKSINSSISNLKNNFYKTKENKMTMINLHKIKRKNLLDSEESIKEIREGNKKLKFSKSSLVDRYILKLINPDEIMEDYIQDNGKPFDRFTKFKKQANKEKIRVGTLLDDLTKVVSENQNQLHIYTMKLKTMKYSYLKENNN